MRGVILGLAGLVAAAPAAAYTPRERVAIHEKRAESPKDFRKWADGRVSDLKSEFDRFGRDLNSAGAKTRSRLGAKSADLRERLGSVEGKLDEVGDKADEESWKARKKARDEIKDIRNDLRDLERRLSRD